MLVQTGACPHIGLGFGSTPRDVVLVAHSYGGMVATGVLWRLPERIRSIIYLDAMVPEPGQCVLDLLAPDAAKALVEHVDSAGEGWKVAPNPLPADSSAADVAWITPRRELPRSVWTRWERDGDG